MNLTLTEPERITLQQLSLNHPHRDIRTKGYGLLLLARKFTPQQIADEIGCSWRVTYDWFHAWEQSGIVGLLGGHQEGRYPAMSPEMITTAVEVATSESLSLARIAQRVEEIHGPLAGMTKWLQRNGFSYRKPVMMNRASCSPDAGSKTGV
ncbi:helix-turn-helix domain-containing protein [Salmonella enterica]|nr:helix-turn-helix domain-containing protein [Salmonella enterica]MJK42092.1 transposase [Salmonella enterica subsp. diarizonae]EJM5007507.1 helix-turn-helix domain-containing protein [Salmonella enterica]EKK6344506.1 helix-turn-helix domain-containing protein [Salmonella enterica]ELO7819515.1 helix-turn-helix domain-containing protein [Salmonella enterica]